MKNYLGIWTTRRELTTPQERQAIKRDLEAAFAQAFLGTCFFCGGSTKPNDNGGYACQDCGRTQ